MSARRTLCAAVLCAATLSVPAHAGSATASRAWQFKPAPDARLAVDNLVGDVDIEPAADGGFHVTAKVTVEADTDAAAAALVGKVDFRSADAGAQSTFQVLLPEASFPAIYDSKASAGLFFGRTYVDYLGERRRLSADAGKCVRVRVDLVVRVPAGTTLAVHNRIGHVEVRGANASLSLRTARGSIASSKGRGPLEADTGSGAIAVAEHDGEVNADTGSGEISIVDCRCRIEADTGSGAVRVLRGSGSVEADTGSGAVDVRDFAGAVDADTGSGSVTVKGLRAASALAADTGSGGVSISGDLAALERLEVETGSGSVAISASAWPSMRITMSVGAGSIDAEVPGAELRREGRRAAELVIGAATGRGSISTGSGSISLGQAAAPAQ